MFIDTTTANARTTRPHIIISPTGAAPTIEHSTPLLDAFVGQDVPPSYLEATTPGLYSSRLSGEEGARLLPYDDREAVDAARKEEKYRRKGLGDQCFQKRAMKAIALVLTVMTLAAMLAAMLAAVSSRQDKQAMISPPASSSLPSAQNSDKDSSHPQGFIDDDPDKPELIAIPWPTQLTTPAKPLPSSPSSKEEFPIRWPSKCGQDYKVKTEEYNFEKPSELHLQEAVHQLDGAYKKVAGWIHIAQAPAGQPPGTIQARMAYAVSSSVDVNTIRYTFSGSGFTIGDPSFPDGFDGVGRGTACLGISLVLYVAPGAVLTTLNVMSTHMGMQIHNGVDLSVTDSTSVSLTTGTLEVDAANFISREAYLKTISGSISGKYSLADVVSVKTRSGSVNINVEPKVMRLTTPNPAKFIVDTHSGSIRVDFSRKRIPERDYQTFINTTVGSVDGAFIHGSRTEISSVAGLVVADLLPFKSAEFHSELHTQTHSGQMNITLRSPYRAREVPMNGLFSTHRSSSGGLAIVYPDEWTGYVNGTSLSGALNMQGESLALLKENNLPGNNHVEATKGTGRSLMSFDTISGNCEIKVGKT
ncbi:hypothetical protein ACN47E_009025 [Coniothyrium glycines]